MAETRGLVQHYKIRTIRLAFLHINVFWIYIGPSPTNTQLFSISFGDSDQPRELAYKRSMATGLQGAMLARREVIVTHPQDSGRIDGIQIVAG
jgi:hypothetical protein